jgi:putative intracellular protease/amidase
MTATVDILHPDRPTRVLMVASNPTVSPVTGWPVGFWWAELTHSWWEFTEHGYVVELASPEGGELRGDSWSDPRDESGYSAHDLISLGFIDSPAHAGLVEATTPLGEVAIGDYDAVLFVGGQGPMFTFVDNEQVHRVLSAFYDAGKVTGVICQDLDRLRQRRGTVRRRLRRPPHPALLDRGRGPQARRHQLHRPGAVQGPRRARRQPRHRPAAVLRGGGRPPDDQRARDVISGSAVSRALR